MDRKELLFKELESLIDRIYMFRLEIGEDLVYDTISKLAIIVEDLATIFQGLVEENKEQR